MNLFDQLVAEAIKNQRALAPLRPVVEKELLHHDILRELSSAGLLARLTFIGGTCLRACYGSRRLSEDLDFAGGAGFDRKDLAGVADLLVGRLHAKYGLRVEVSEPVREVGNIDTWKIRIQTRPERADLPGQRIHLDIAAVPSHDPCPMLLRNPYGVEMGTSGLIVRASSREEILADKILAFALRPNRLKNRDLWDIVWLRQQGIQLPDQLVPIKIADHHRTIVEFRKRLEERQQQLAGDPGLRSGFQAEMERFLPPDAISETVIKTEFWDYLVAEIGVECSGVLRVL
ncbi:MAG: nucleotidyl transferase AbiEii/AbiGii toxin family protein [Akkermansiaceae bacterium]|nr:nucleotidyl transferase AbiEii/AbiGii toxin family protein [Akkermansiaceae bacterium]